MAVKILGLTDFAKDWFGFAAFVHENSLKVIKQGYNSKYLPRIKIPLSHSCQFGYASVAQW